MNKSIVGELPIKTFSTIQVFMYSFIHVFYYSTSTSTSNLKPQTSNLKPETLSAGQAGSNPKPQTRNNKQQIKKMKIFNLLLLDESGSMQAIYDATLSGCNEVLQTIKAAAADPELEQWVQLTSFNSIGIRDRIPLGKATDLPLLTQRDYQPNATTPLYDAMGLSFTNLLQATDVAGDVQVHCSIITDGLENASREYDHTAIRSLIADLRGRGWEFVFIGADYDVEKVAMQMGIRSTIRYHRTGLSTGEMFAREAQERSDYYAQKKKDRNAPMKAFNIRLDQEGKDES